MSQLTPEEGREFVRIVCLEDLLTAVREVLEIRCNCHECWTDRGRHDPHGCTWAELGDVREAMANYDTARAAQAVLPESDE